MAFSVAERDEIVCRVLADALDAPDAEGRWLCVYEDGQVSAELEELGGSPVRWTRWAFAGREASALPPEGPFDQISLRLPQGREALQRDLHLLAGRLAPAGSLWVHGANDEGIKSVGKRLEPLFEHVEVVSTRRHCRVWRASGPGEAVDPDPERFVSETRAEVAGLELTWASVPGLFAHGRLDDASRMLLETLPTLEGPVLDFGCGSGVLSRFLQTRGDPVELHLADVDALALELARRNVPGGTTWLSEGLPSSGVPYRAIVTNPPLHRGKSNDPGPLRKLLELAPAHLARGGSLWLVTQGAQPLRPDLEKRFSSVERVRRTTRFGVWHATT